MLSIFRNPEMKRICARLLLLQLILAVIVFIFVQYNMMGLNGVISGQNTALLGKILYSHPELENEIVGYITKGASPDEMAAGKQVLKQYGYSKDMDISLQPVLKDFSGSFTIYSSFLVLLFFIPLLLLVILEYKKIFDMVQKTSNAAEKVVEGDFTVELKEEGEGEFAILSHSFNAMADRLKSNIEILRNEKLFLKNMISDISHQLKTPLSSLIMFNDIMLEKKDMDEDSRKDFLLRNRSQLFRMEWLILSLLKLARLETGAINFEKRMTSLGVCVKKSLESMKSVTEDKKQKVTLKGGLEDVCFCGDEEWTTEALTNIIKNSIEHTKDGGEISIEISKSPLFCRIEITDNGEGIDKQDLPHIFERFYKGKSDLKSESIGIGLAIAKNIVEGQDGTIHVSSEKGRGSKFTITFLKGIV